MKTQHFEIHWPEDLRPCQTFPSTLPDPFQPLYTGLENTWLSGVPGQIALQRLPGGQIHFGHLQSSLSAPRTVRIHTLLPTLFFTACHEGQPQWAFAGQSANVDAIPGTHFAVALPPGETRLILPVGFCRFTCFIMAGHRLQLVARDHAMLRPAIEALQFGSVDAARLLPACPTHQGARETFDYLSTKQVDSASRRNVLYKNKLHAILSGYDGQLELEAERHAHSNSRLYARALALMEKHRDDPDYGIRQLADELAMTTRRVQYAFREHGTTFTRSWIEMRRNASPGNNFR